MPMWRHSAQVAHEALSRLARFQFVLCELASPESHSNFKGQGSLRWTEGVGRPPAQEAGESRVLVLPGPSQQLEAYRHFTRA